jgi:hypothetical protein
MTDPFIASQRESKSTSGWPGETKQGWNSVPINVYSRELTGFVPGDDSMANHPMVGVVAQPYLMHAEFPDAPSYRPEEVSPGMVANKYELIFTQRGRPVQDKSLDKFMKWRHPTRSCRPDRPPFTPGITLRNLNRLLNSTEVQADISKANAILQNMVFFGAVDSVGPGESMVPDRNQKNYVTVIKQRVICWNVWEGLELALEYLYIDVVKGKGKNTYRLVPTHAASHKDHAELMQERLDTGGGTTVHSYFVGRAGPHEQGGIGDSVSQIVRQYVEGKDVDISFLPKIVIYILDH